MMRRIHRLFGLPVVLFVLAACESPTSLEDVTMEGLWDLVGTARGSGAPAIQLRLNPEVDGVFTGTWTYPNGGQGAVLGIRPDTRTVEFTLAGFPGGNREFEGAFRNFLELVGTADFGQTAGQPVFRRASF